MANWARGLASGLETGYRLGEVMQRGAERRALREAATAQPEVMQGYTAEQGAQHRGGGVRAPQPLQALHPARQPGLGRQALAHWLI